MTNKSVTDDLGRALQGWQSEEDKNGLHVSASYCFAQDFCGFAGHFPGRAVLPAIVQLASVRYLVEQALAKKLQALVYERIKFRGVVGVDQTLSVQGVVIEHGAGWQVNFSIQHEEDKVADGSFVLGEV